MTTLEGEFHRAMVSIYELAKDHDYYATSCASRYTSSPG